MAGDTHLLSQTLVCMDATCHAMSGPPCIHMIIFHLYLPEHLVWIRRIKVRVLPLSNNCRVFVTALIKKSPLSVICVRGCVGGQYVWVCWWGWVGRKDVLFQRYLVRLHLLELGLDVNSGQTWYVTSTWWWLCRYKDRFDVSTERPNQCRLVASLPVFLNDLQVVVSWWNCIWHVCGNSCDDVVLNKTTFNLMQVVIFT